MNIQTFCDGIGLSPEARRVVENLSMDEAVYREFKELFLRNQSVFFEKVKREPNSRQLFLYLYVRFAVDAYGEYRIKGISDEIYFDTFHDLEIWCRTCLRDYGEYGLAEIYWLQEHVLLQLFKLGRLQFQPVAFGEDLEIEGTRVSRGQIVLNVHIPEGEPLDPGKVEESFRRARAFFRGVTPVFVCHSWLLYPKLSEVLEPDSNILQFQRHFHIYKVDDHSRQAEQRIFQTNDFDLSRYAERTSLQRRAKTYLQAGHKLGSGSGIKFNY
jgi:hypothetical protein